MSIVPRRYCGPSSIEMRDVHRLLVGRQLDERRADLDLDVAAVPVVRLQQQQIALEHVLAVGPGLRDDRQDVPLVGQDHLAQLVVGDGVVADEVDPAHLDLRVLVDAEPDVDLRRRVALQLVGDLRHVEALLDVELLDLLDVLLQLGRVEDLLLLDVEDLVDLGQRHLVVAGDVDLVDGRLLLEHEDDRPGRPCSRCSRPGRPRRSPSSRSCARRRAGSPASASTPGWVLRFTLMASSSTLRLPRKRTRTTFIDGVGAGGSASSSAAASVGRAGAAARRARRPRRRRGRRRARAPGATRRARRPARSPRRRTARAPGVEEPATGPHA